MQFHSSYKCAETSELNFFPGAQIFRQTCDSSKSVQIWREVILYFMQITFETRKSINDFIFWGREFQSDAPAKDMLVLA